jgi:hypothetical protein
VPQPAHAARAHGRIQHRLRNLSDTLVWTFRRALVGLPIQNEAPKLSGVFREWRTAISRSRLRTRPVDVTYTPSANEPRGKLYGLIFTIATLISLPCVVLLLPGKHGNPSMWHDLTHTPSVSSLIIIPTGLMLFVGLFGWQGFRYARAAWASDETFHCDREAITIRRIPWLDFSNRTWRTYTYPLSEVSAIRFAVIASMKGKHSGVCVSGLLGVSGLFLALKLQKRKKFLRD